MLAVLIEYFHLVFAQNVHTETCPFGVPHNHRFKYGDQGHNVSVTYLPNTFSMTVAENLLNGLSYFCA